jgi:hypothetical protein
MRIHKDELERADNPLKKEDGKKRVVPSDTQTLDDVAW